MADRTGLFGLPALTLRVIRTKRVCSKSFLTILSNRSNPVYTITYATYVLPGFGDQVGLNMADRTGFEPATSGVTGRHSNQLNYRSVE